MAKVTVINHNRIEAASARSLDQAIRDSVRLRCRVQLLKLCGDFFDEVDDFLFASGSKGQFTEDSNYLKAMRELRTKQNLFEEAFIDITATTLFTTSADDRGQGDSHANHLVDDHAEMYEMLEIDLALQAMQRKADKAYGMFDQQLDALFTRVQFAAGKGMQPRFVLINACLWSFGEAQRVFALPLDIRLVVIKLFEQHFLLKLERLYLDVINIVKHVLSKGAVDNPALAASELSVVAKKTTEFHRTQIVVADKKAGDGELSSQTIDNAVDAAVSAHSKTPHLPAFVADMLRCKWRSVLFLIGMNRGCHGQEWQQAIASMQLLVDCTTGQVEVAPEHLEALLQELGKGFNLLQMPAPEQARFTQQVRDWLQRRTALAAAEFLATADKAETVTPPEASLSPSGKKILDREDLDDITSLLGAETMEISKSAMERELMDCLPEIDRLQNDVVVEYKIDGRFESCSLQKNLTRPGMFQITASHSKTTIARSRLGLAISLHEGELKLPYAPNPARAAEKTLVEFHPEKEHS